MAREGFAGPRWDDTRNGRIIFESCTEVSGFSLGPCRRETSLYDFDSRIQGGHLAPQQSGEVPGFRIVDTAESGFNFGDRASIKIPSDKLGFSGKRLLRPASTQGKTGEVAADAILLCLLQSRSLARHLPKEKNCSDI